MTIAPEPHFLSTEPVIRPAPLAALAAERQATETHFRRDHFGEPAVAPSDWWLQVGDALDVTLDALRELPHRELTVALECAGHRRSELRPAPRGVQWGVGAVSEARWAGTSLRNVLADVGPATKLVVLEGADSGPFRDTGIVPFARALPLEKALHPDTLLAWEMNGEPIPNGHGGPVRAIVPGWYATDSVKWLRRILLVDAPFAGPFEAVDYRIAGERLTALPVHALLTSHRPGERVSRGELLVRGIAWGGEGGVARVELSADGRSWHDAELTRSNGGYGFTHWQLVVPAATEVLTIAVRATDSAGRSQPAEPRWNEGGYANSSIQRVTLSVH